MCDRLSAAAARKLWILVGCQDWPKPPNTFRRVMANEGCRQTGRSARVLSCLSLLTLSFPLSRPLTFPFLPLSLRPCVVCDLVVLFVGHAGA